MLSNRPVYLQCMYIKFNLWRFLPSGPRNKLFSLTCTVEACYNEDLLTMTITLIYQGKNAKKCEELGPAK